MDWIKDFSISRAKFDHLNLKRYPIFIKPLTDGGPDLANTNTARVERTSEQCDPEVANSCAIIIIIMIKIIITTPRMPEKKTPPVNHEPFINSRLDKVGPPRLECYEDNDKNKLREMP